MTKDTQNRDATIERLLEGLTRRPDKSGGECLDAETLAAWADDGLSPGELAAAQAHAADCGRCQAVLAALAKATPATPVARPAAWGIPSLRWLVPLTAAAAAATVWFVVPGREHSVSVRQVSEIVESVPPPAVAGAPTDAVASSAAKAASGGVSREPAAPSRGKSTETDQKAAESRDANAGARLEPGPPATATVSAAAAPAAQSAADASTAAPSAAVPAAAAARAFAFAATERVIVSPNPASRWRILRGGAVQRSADGGGTWQTQNTGVADTLSAGSSPSPSVCWLVGPGGIVLLSTDDRAWQRLPFPEAVPLVAVRATDDRTATVTTADGREFVTTDGGQQWARAPER